MFEFLPIPRATAADPAGGAGESGESGPTGATAESFATALDALSDVDGGNDAADGAEDEADDDLTETLVDGTAVAAFVPMPDGSVLPLSLSLGAAAGELPSSDAATEATAGVDAGQTAPAAPSSAAFTVQGVIREWFRQRAGVESFGDGEPTSDAASAANVATASDGTGEAMAEVLKQIRSATERGQTVTTTPAVLSTGPAVSGAPAAPPTATETGPVVPSQSAVPAAVVVDAAMSEAAPAAGEPALPQPGSDRALPGITKNVEPVMPGGSTAGVTVSEEAAAIDIEVPTVPQDAQTEAGDAPAPTVSTSGTTPAKPHAGTPDSSFGGQSPEHGQAFSTAGHGTAPQLLASSLRLAHASFTQALSTTALDETLPAETAHQIVQSLKMQWAKGGGEADIRLEPRHFGELRIALKVEQRQVSARLEAEAPVVREWLHTNQAALKLSLAEHNLTLERLEIAEPRESRDRDADRRHPNGRDGQPRPRHQRRRPGESGELFEVVA